MPGLQLPDKVRLNVERRRVPFERVIEFRIGTKAVVIGGRVVREGRNRQDRHASDYGWRPTRPATAGAVYALRQEQVVQEMRVAHRPAAAFSDERVLQNINAGDRRELTRAERRRVVPDVLNKVDWPAP